MTHHGRVALGGFLVAVGLTIQYVLILVVRGGNEITNSMMKAFDAAVLAGIAGLALLMVGCVQPSRVQYKALLHECREANREHLRLWRGETEACAAGKASHVSQAMGSVEFGEGGH